MYRLEKHSWGIELHFNNLNVYKIHPSDSPQGDTDFNYGLMMQRDERRFRVADRNGDLTADKEEFTAFLHPEEFNHMKDIVVQVKYSLRTISILEQDYDTCLLT